MFVGRDLLPTSATVNLVVTAGYFSRAAEDEGREGGRSRTVADVAAPARFARIEYPADPFCTRAP